MPTKIIHDTRTRQKSQKPQRTVAAPHDRTIQEVIIERLSTDGRGVARLQNGKVAFVKGALPGETVTMQPLSEHSKYLDGEVVEVKIPSAQRIKPICPHADACGGCQLQHLNPQTHGTTKSQWFLETLARLGRWSETEREQAKNLLKIIEPKGIGCRRRLRVHFNGVDTGFKKSGSNTIIPFENCAMAHPSIQHFWKRIQSTLHNFGESNREIVGAEIEITVPDLPVDRLVLEVVVLETAPSNRAMATKKALQRTLNELEFAWNQDYFTLLPYKSQHNQMLVHRRSFVQPHTEASSLYAEQVYQHLNRFIEEHKTVLKEIVAWDLYAGSGLFSLLPIFAAKEQKISLRCTAVESHTEAVLALQRNALDFAHLDIRRQDVPLFLTAQEHAQSESCCHIAIVDPPRAGLGLEHTAQLCRLLSETSACLIYIACDPACLARDGRAILDAGFRLKDVTIYHCFPQTTHYEVISIFER